MKKCFSKDKNKCCLRKKRAEYIKTHIENVGECRDDALDVFDFAC